MSKCNIVYMTFDLLLPTRLSNHPILVYGAPCTSQISNSLPRQRGDSHLGGSDELAPRQW